MQRLLSSSIYLIALLTGSIPVWVGAQDTAAESESLIICGGWLFDGFNDNRRRNSGILIQGDKIVAVDLPTDKASSIRARVIELTDSETFLPGLIDLHAHCNFDLIDKGRVEEVV